MAEVDTSIYGGVRPKSAFEYMAEMDQADAAKQAKESNRLALLIQQGQYQDQTQARGQRNRLAAALQGLGGGATDDDVVRAYRSVGDMSGAASYQEGILKRKGEEVKNLKESVAAANDRLKQYRGALDFIDTPAGAARWLQAQYQDPVTASIMQSLGPIDQAIQQIPQTPQEFQNWRKQAAMGMEKHIAEMRLQGVADQAARNDLIGPDGQVNLPLLNAKRQVASAGKTTVSVNTGQKGFENEMKLRDDFKQEPIYKAHQEVQSAYQQIKSALGQKSPAGDLAGATKIMKLLDPGSVVRESELGMAMAASGLMDRISNYAQMTMSGQKLTPTQRQDFQALADKLYGASVEQFNTKRSEYEKIGSEYGLNAPRALGPEVKKQTNKVLKFDANGNPVQQ